MHTKALTLLEVIISVVILSLVITGLVNVFILGKRYIEHSRCRVTAAEIGKDFLDPYARHVRQDTWVSDPLTNASANYTIGNITYSVAGVVSDLGNIKKVKATVSWNEQATY